MPDVTPTTLRVLAATMANHPRWATEEYALRAAAAEIERLDREYVAVTGDMIRLQRQVQAAEALADAVGANPNVTAVGPIYAALMAFYEAQEEAADGQ